jgi:hypothetical protein
MPINRRYIAWGGAATALIAALGLGAYTCAGSREVKKAEPYTETLPLGRNTIKLNTISSEATENNIHPFGPNSPVIVKDNGGWFEITGNLNLTDRDGYDSPRDPATGKRFLNGQPKTAPVTIAVSREDFRRYLQDFNWRNDRVGINPDNPPHVSRRLVYADTNGDKIAEEVYILTGVEGGPGNFTFGADLGAPGISEELLQKLRKTFTTSRDRRATEGIKEEMRVWDDPSESSIK